MSTFPRTSIEGLSVSRLIAGTNWFLGYTHNTKAQDDFVTNLATREHIARTLTVFLKAGVDTLLGARASSPQLTAAIKDAEQAVGRPMILISTPTLELADTPAAYDRNCNLLDGVAELGVKVCMPHQQTTDALLCRRTRSIPGMEKFCAMIRHRNMIPGLSTHMPESPVYADETGLDVGTYIQIYNAAGFLMQIEIDWVHRMIWKSKKPVITIKPMAAGRLPPLVGMAFNWATIRPQDMICVGCMTPDEAKEIIENSLAQLEHRQAHIELQRTRSKESVERQKD